jgi:hypothetical protein
MLNIYEICRKNKTSNSNQKEIIHACLKIQAEIDLLFIKITEA